MTRYDDSVQVCFPLSFNQHERLQAFANRSGRYQVDILEMIVTDWLDNEFDPKPRERTVIHTTLANVLYLRRLLEIYVSEAGKKDAIGGAQRELTIALKKIGLDEMDLGVDIRRPSRGLSR